jgi:hypothetical protein
MDGNAERGRLEEARDGTADWKRWGPYLSERQWGTVREDYSPDGDAWSYFTHDQSRSRAYRWGEDGIAGISDDHQRICFALALWNGHDPILKERLFGLTNAEGNHGEDVKEYYFYVDSTPTHSWMRYLYKYPHRAYPYEDLVVTNRSRGRDAMEYELLETGVFDEDRYFDVTIDYAKAGPDDLVVRITAANRGPDDAPLDLLPTVWFRNTWSWGAPHGKPTLRALATVAGAEVVEVHHDRVGTFHFYAEGASELLFTENDTNFERVFGASNPQPFVKDAFHRFVVDGEDGAVNPEQAGTKAAARWRLVVPAGGEVSVRLRLTSGAPLADPFADADVVLAARQADADDFYRSVTPPSLNADQADVMRQALAGMLWTKQYYRFDVDTWLREHGAHPLRGGVRQSRNQNWFHMVNDDIISMPDKWEYPWYAAWDLAFHTLALNVVDHDFAMDQLQLMLSEVYLHPSGQIPAYEWNFGDVNPPVHAWATLFCYTVDKHLRGRADVEFLKVAFQKLLLNFTWWVNRKDLSGKNVFEGGFLGLDNIGVFDRSQPLPTGGTLEQADGTAWMALFAQNMIEIAIELTAHDESYADLVVKFVQHFFWIAAAMDRAGEHDDEMWGEEDGFFYDVLRMPDGSAQRIKVRSLVGLLPLCACSIVDDDVMSKHPAIVERITQLVERNDDLLQNVADPAKQGVAGRRLLAVLNEAKLRRVLARMLDEERFLGPHGIRSLSKWHEQHPYEFDVHGEQYTVKYLPAESDSGLFGGNSNWRGPVWMPVNLLIVRALLTYYLYYGDDFTIECPTGSGQQMTLFEVAIELASRLTGIFLRDDSGRRPVFGGSEAFQTDPHWRDHILFYEYFHGDDGAGLGASHQTGWTGTVAFLLQMLGVLDAKSFLAGGTEALRRVYATDA